jgi:hypothetical protein
MAEVWRARAIALIGCAVLAMMGAGVITASASAEIQQGVIVEGNIADPHEAVPPYTVKATLTATSDRSTLTITNPASNADLGGSAVITEANLLGPDGWTADQPGNPDTPYEEGGEFIYRYNGGINPTTDKGGCDGPSAGSDFHRQTPQSTVCVFSSSNADTATGGIAPGESATITYSTAPAEKGNLLFELRVDFDFDDLWPQCRPSGYSDDVRHSGNPVFGALAVAASSGSFGYASDCVPPLKARITSTKINAHAHTAAFKQTAQHATGFFCQLYRGRHLMFAHNCGAKKAYTHPLPSGTYTYEAWGLNKHGRSPSPATVLFKLN